MLQKSKCGQLLQLCSAVPLCLISLWCLLWRQINLNWSCKVLAGHPHKTPQEGFLLYLQLKKSAQIDSTAFIQVLLGKTQKKSHWVRFLNGSLRFPGAENDPIWVPFCKNLV